MLATARGMAIRFNESDARPMGRNTTGVKGISLGKGDALVGMVVADPEATLLTVCEHGYGKRTPFGPNSSADGEGEAAIDDADEAAGSQASASEPETDGEDDEGTTSSSQRYRTQRRGGKGLRDIKTTERNGPVISIVSRHR